MPGYDPEYDVPAADQDAGYQAYLHLLADPDFFAFLYMNPDAWSSSDEVRALESFAQYSNLHTTASALVLGEYDFETGSAIHGAAFNTGLEQLQEALTAKLGSGPAGFLIALGMMSGGGVNSGDQFSGPLYDGLHLSTNDALTAATAFLGEGYQDLGNGRFRSADGLRQVRMGIGDIEDPRGPHINFEMNSPVPGQPGRYTNIVNMHIYLDD
jgi:hypothetical protein